MNGTGFLQSFVQELLSLLDFREKNPRLILVGGLSRSGKTVLSKQLVEEGIHLGLDVLRLPLDHWIVSVEKRPANSTVRDRYEAESICKGVRALLAGREIHPPLYDPETRRRLAEHIAAAICPPRHLLITEGTLALVLPPLRELAWRRLYVQTDPYQDEARVLFPKV